MTKIPDIDIYDASEITKDDSELDNLSIPESRSISCASVYKGVAIVIGILGIVACLTLAATNPLGIIYGCITLFSSALLSFIIYGQGIIMQKLSQPEMKK